MQTVLLIWLALLCCHTSGSTINHEHHRVICYDREPCVLIKDSFSFIPLCYFPPFVILVEELDYTTLWSISRTTWRWGVMGHLSCLSCRQWRSQRSCTLPCKMRIKKPQSWWSSLCYLLVQVLLLPHRQPVVTPSSSRETRPPPFPCQWAGHFSRGYVGYLQWICNFPHHYPTEQPLRWSKPLICWLFCRLRAGFVAVFSSWHCITAI